MITYSLVAGKQSKNYQIHHLELYHVWLLPQYSQAQWLIIGPRRNVGQDRDTCIGVLLKYIMMTATVAYWEEIIVENSQMPSAEETGGLMGRILICSAKMPCVLLEN
jgi:hypothetical protein